MRKLKKSLKNIRKLLIFFDIPWEQKQFSGNFVKDTPAGRQAGIFFEKKTPALRKTGKSKAADTGCKKLIAGSDSEFTGNSSIYEKTACKKQDSKAFKRALTGRDEIINMACKTSDLNNVKELFAEDLKNVKHKSKGRIFKKFNTELQRRSYSEVLNKLTMPCEEAGILFRKIPPQYTSRRCCKCGVICKSDRNGEIYKCA